MQATTWKDKVVDPSNHWLSATRAEDDGRLDEAIVYYLRDASGCLSRGLRARAALSCSCAATCLEKTANTNAARHLYVEAARMYEAQADATFGSSIREALWSLQEAHDFYVAGGESQKAVEVYDRCASLVKKLSPFVTNEKLDEALRIRRDAQLKPLSFSIPASKSPDVTKAVDDFIRMRETNVPAVAASPKTPADRTRRRPSIEKSIVS